jgi:hypothetical protein
MAKYDDMSFGKAFAAARKEKGAGKTFTWEGKSYTTDRADDKPSKGESGSTDIAAMAKEAIDRSGPTRPRARPSSDKAPTRPRSRPVDKAPTATSVSTPKVETQTLGAGPEGASGSMTVDGNRYTYGQWQNMTRAERKAAGLPVSAWGGAIRAMKNARGLSNMSDETEMAKGGMVKKSGYAKGGMVKANCGASMKPAQKGTKK